VHQITLCICSISVIDNLYEYAKLFYTLENEKGLRNYKAIIISQQI